MGLNLFEHLSNLGLLNEQNNWYEVYTKGDPRRQIKPTDKSILDYVRNFLLKIYEGEKEFDMKKVNNSRLAPWIVNFLIKLGGVGNVGTKEEGMLKTIGEWFKSTKSGGTVEKIKNKELDDAYALALKDLEDLKKKESSSTQEKRDLPPEIKNFIQQGMIRVAAPLPDGRVWVEVLKKDFFDNLCPLDKTYGIQCQANQGAGSKYVGGDKHTYTLLGPEKNKPDGPFTSLMSIATDGDLIYEFRSIKNQLVTSPSLGWDDLAEQFVKFFLYYPEMKKYTMFGGWTTSMGAFTDLLKKRPDLSKTMIMGRPELMVNNKNEIERELGKDWMVLLNQNIVDLARTNPIMFLENLENFERTKGKEEVKNALKEINFKNIADFTNQHFIRPVIEYLSKILSIEEFKKMIYDKVDFQIYSSAFENIFRNLINNEGSSKKALDNLMFLIGDNFDYIVKHFSEGKAFGKGIDNLMKYLSNPKLDAHQDFKIKRDGTRVATVNDERHGEVREINVSDNLSILPEKERRKILDLNKETIKKSFGGSEEDKEIAFLMHYISQLSDQETKKRAEEYKEKIINYYDDLYSKGRTLLPGILEYSRALNKNNPEKREKLSLEKSDVNKYKIKLIEYFIKKSKKESRSENLTVKVYDGIIDFINLMKSSGFSNDTANDTFLKSFAPEKIKKMLGRANMPNVSDVKTFVVNLYNLGFDKKTILSYLNDFNNEIMPRASHVDRLVFKDLISDLNNDRLIKEGISENIAYSAIVLDEKSKKELLEKFEDWDIPSDWEVVSDHITLNMGPLQDKSILDKSVKIRVMSIAKDDKVAAVGIVSPIAPDDRKPHITLAVNRNNGGAPKMSKELVKWKPIGRPFYITGTVKEMPNKL